MELTYPGKQSEHSILHDTPAAALKTVRNPGRQAAVSNQLIHGENLQVMKRLLTENVKVDLIYIDPPFARNTTFRVGRDRVATVSTSRLDEVAYHDKRMGSEFIEYIRARLILLRELLSEHGSIYLHIDDKIGHYVKVIMDEVFGRDRFRNDISRIKCNPKNFSRRAFGNVKDVIFFYSKTGQPVWNQPTIAAREDAIVRLFPKIDNQGRRYTTNPLHAPGETKNGESGKAWNGMMPPAGRHWRYSMAILDQLEREGRIEWSAKGNPRSIIYADDHKNQRLQDIWEFKDSQRPVYPTEKNFDLLKLIVATSSNPGQVVLDAFCGSGTTLLAAQLLGRHWIGIDESRSAINTSISRLTGGTRDDELSGAAFSLREQDTIPHQRSERLIQRIPKAA